MTTENTNNDANLPPVTPEYGGNAPGYSAPQDDTKPTGSANPYAAPAGYSSTPPPPAPNQGYYAAPNYGYAEKEPNAVMAFVMGLLGFLVLSPLGIVAVIIGRKSLNAFKMNPALEGRGLALAGYILGWVAIGAMVLTAIMVIFILVISAAGVGYNDSYYETY